MFKRRRASLAFRRLPEDQSSVEFLLFKLSPLVQYITVDELNSTVIRTGLDTFNFSDIITRIQEMPSSPRRQRRQKTTSRRSFQSATLI